MKKTNQKKEKANKQDNIGYENTKTWNDGDDRENDRVQTSDPALNKDQNPDQDPENKGDRYVDNSGGLRAESSAKTGAGDTEKGKVVKGGTVETKNKRKDRNK